MSGGGLIVGIVMVGIGIAWLALPYLRGGSMKRTPEGDRLRERLTLAAAYERALLTVRDLDEDFQVGKLSQDTYSSERARWVEQGAALLEALEKSGGAPQKTRQNVDSTPASADPVEQAIAAYIRARDQSQQS